MVLPWSFTDLPVLGLYTSLAGITVGVVNGRVSGTRSMEGDGDEGTDPAPLLHRKDKCPNDAPVSLNRVCSCLAGRTEATFFQGRPTPPV